VPCPRTRTSRGTQRTPATTKLPLNCLIALSGPPTVAVAPFGHPSNLTVVSPSLTVCEQLHDCVGIPRREPGAEALEDLEQRGFRLRIRPHDQGILAPGSVLTWLEMG
jgi:hypothetical protein